MAAGSCTFRAAVLTSASGVSGGWGSVEILKSRACSCRHLRSPRRPGSIPCSWCQPTGAGLCAHRRAGSDWPWPFLGITKNSTPTVPKVWASHLSGCSLHDAVRARNARTASVLESLGGTSSSANPGFQWAVAITEYRYVRALAAAGRGRGVAIVTKCLVLSVGSRGSEKNCSGDAPEVLFTRIVRGAFSRKLVCRARPLANVHSWSSPRGASGALSWVRRHSVAGVHGQAGRRQAGWEPRCLECSRRALARGWWSGRPWS